MSLDLGSGNIMPGLPAPLQPSVGIAGDVLFPMVGFDLFGKKALAGQGVSDFDDIKVRAKAVSQRIIPNFPFVPGSYSTARIERARKGKETGFRSEESEAVAFLNSVGFKFQKTDIKNLDIIGSHVNLSGLEVETANDENRAFILKEILNT